MKIANIDLCFKSRLQMFNSFRFNPLLPNGNISSRSAKILILT